MAKDEPKLLSPRDWHRQFVAMLTDRFSGSPFEVEPEKDMSLQQQLLDVLILRKREGTFSERLPDGLDDLADHNLITFKSHHEALDEWALKELTGHYVSYRKQVSPRGELWPEDRFHLYAVCARYPQNLARQLTLQERQPGVYDCERGTDRFRIVVAAQLPRAEQNAGLHLFSASREQFEYGARHFRPRSPDTSTLLYRLLQGYQLEGVPMPFSLEQYFQEFIEEHGKELLARVPTMELTKQLTRERVEDLPDEERLRLLQLFQEKPSPTKKKPGKR